MVAPEPSPRAPSRRNRSELPTGNARHRRKTRLVLVGGILVAVGGLFAYYFFALAARARHHEYAVTFPVPAPRGEPIAIGHDLKAGDVFATRLETKFRIVLSVEMMDPKDGMSLDAILTTTHGVTPLEGDAAGGLLSTYRVGVNRADSNPSDWKTKVWVVLGNPVTPCRLTQERDADGTPRVGRAGSKLTPYQAEALRLVRCGLDDIAANYLPPRAVRLGEVWDLSEAMSTDGILSAVRFIARTDEFATGYPEPKLVAKVAAEAVEPRDGEECLRCRLVVYVTQEGDVVPPALEGRLSTAARIEGGVWVSMSKGIVWESDFHAEITTSYLSVRPTERRARADMRAKTTRAERMPD